MSDVRLVAVDCTEEILEVNSGFVLTAKGTDFITDDPNGTHLLVPVEWVTVTGEWLTVDDDRSHGHLTECPACSGSGKQPIPFLPSPGGYTPCTNCNERGWVLKGGEDE